MEDETQSFDRVMFARRATLAFRLRRLDAFLSWRRLQWLPNHRGTPVIGPGQLETYTEFKRTGIAALTPLPL